MYDDFLAVRCCSKLSAKFLLGTSAAEGGTFVIFFYFLLEQPLEFVLNFQQYSNSSEHLILVRIRETLLL